MPLYEYHCSKCDKTFEVMQKFSDAPLTEHEGCGGALEKLLSAPAFQLKGTGWYATDYAKPKGGSGSKEDGGSPAKSETKSESKSEAKPDSKSESKGESKPDSSSKETKSESKPAATKAD